MSDPQSTDTQDELVELFAEIARSYDERTVWQVHSKVKTLINSQALKLLDRLESSIRKGMTASGNNTEYMWHNTTSAIQEERKRYIVDN